MQPYIVKIVNEELYDIAVRPCAQEARIHHVAAAWLEQTLRLLKDEEGLREVWVELRARATSDGAIVEAFEMVAA